MQLVARLPRWGPELTSRSLHVGLVVEETESGYVFLQFCSATNFNAPIFISSVPVIAGGQASSTGIHCYPSIQVVDRAYRSVQSCHLRSL